jgi:hypothetical protein
MKTKEQFIQEKLNAPERESKFGYHFISEYMENPYMFYLKYVVGLQPVFTMPALLFGGSIHDAIHGFYETGDPDTVVEAFIAIHESKRDKYEYDDRFTTDLNRGHVMLQKWASEIPLTEAEEWELVEAEVEHDFPLLNGFHMTNRPDRVMKHRTRRQFKIKEVKTTGYSVDKMYESVERSDQITVQVLALIRDGIALADDIWVEPEILYQKGRVVKVESPALIKRNQSEIMRCEMSLIASYGRLYNSLKLLDKGFPVPMAFPFNGTSNRMFSHDLDRLRHHNPELLWQMRQEGQAPEGFKLDERVLNGLLYEFIERWEKTKDYEVMKEALNEYNR